MNRIYPISIKKIDASLEFYIEVLKTHSEAEVYLSEFKWCEKIIDSHLYYNLGNTLCVFLFNIENNQSTEEGDNFLWVIVGDLPSMYLDTYYAKSLLQALETYIDLGNNWANNVIGKKSLKDCFPFDEKPNLELARLLKSRVEFIRNTLLTNIIDIKLVI
jgi:hypothetical protein